MVGGFNKTLCQRIVSVFCRFLRTSFVWLKTNVIATCLFLEKTLSRKNLFFCLLVSHCFLSFHNWMLQFFLILVANFLKHATFWSKIKYKFNFWHLNIVKFDLLIQIIKSFADLFLTSKLQLDEGQSVIGGYHTIFILLKEKVWKNIRAKLLQCDFLSFFF